MIKNLFLLVWLLTLVGLKGQTYITDDNWYIVNSKGRTSGNPLTYSSLNIGNSFKIVGATPPGVLNMNGLPRKDLFAIYDNGKFLIKSYTQNAWDGSGFKDFEINDNGTQYMPDYLYVTNIYQGDDPPGTTAENSTAASPDNLLDGALSVTDGILANQDVVAGEDLVIILSDSIFRNCYNETIPGSDRINLQISGVSGVTGNPLIMKTRNFFNNGLSCSFNSDAGWNYTTDDGFLISIGNIDRPGANRYHFINLYSDFENEDYLNRSISIKAQCTQRNESWTIEKEIRDVHDPNKIEVVCVYKKRKFLLFGPYRYCVKYLVEFFNDGSDLVDKVKVKLTMPSCALVNTIKMDNRSFGGTGGCGMVRDDYFFTPGDPGTNDVVFHLSEIETTNLAAQASGWSSSPIEEQYGRFEFCIEVNQDPGDYATILKPTNPKTVFGDNEYPITKFIDPFIINRDPKDWKKFRPYGQCKCDCKFKQGSASTDVQQR